MSRSFIEVEPDSHFPIQNLPYGVFRPLQGGDPRIGVAIGRYVLDLAALDEAGCFGHTAVHGKGVFAQPSLNAFMAMGRPVWQEVRSTVARLLDNDEPLLRDNDSLRMRVLRLQSEVELLLPAEIGDYTDFYASEAHATNVGTLFRGKDNALMPNWRHLPVGYHGRASSVVVSGTEVRRPQGQLKPPDAAAPVFGPSRQLDFELEMGWLIGAGNEQGRPIPIAEAEDHLFGLVLVNDWSARDIQAWEYQPLGPFLGKSFATSISPWVVPLEALAPFRVPALKQDPEPLPYLRHDGKAGSSSYDIHLEVSLQSEAMVSAERISASNYRHLYWTIAQQVAHHTVGGCNLRPGDLLASGTISGEKQEARGCMLELTWRGTEPIRLNGGEERVWLADGDRLTLSGWCQGDGYRVGFGVVTGLVLPALRMT
ncbi:fumarylacetoacetase [Paenibacillus rhizovicinus]|uniref:fumarylacetoacetase n=1 Tax=Paenibacillus rhizovicinus TaxID=2704463 RepID=A0A6C0P8B9_9BACL|nr:fumarylacetoacetase [Paenibacillus rhizovicinus]QHW34827.1 fumarylacetoacetase [Paenibacillus rhizovicinus]